MSVPTRRRVALLVLVVVPLAAVTVALARAWERRRAVEAHLDRDETRLHILNPAKADLALFRAGRTLDEAEPLPLGPEETWLSAERHFLKARRETSPWLYPISLAARDAREELSGTFTVTVRRPGVGAPPRLDSAGAPWVFVPAGSFVIGDARNPGEAHVVYVTAFYLGSFEATNAEFRRFLEDAEGYEDRTNWTEAGWRWKAGGLLQATARMEPSHPDYRRFGEDDLPVMTVTWYEANAFCRWLTRRLGGGRWLYRLPTEAEWEKAARGPDGFHFGLGTELSEPQADLYNWKKNPSADVTLVGLGETRARYRPNRYGVYHASGNAREWTQSVFRPYGRRRPYRDDERNRDETSGMRVTRGGSWYSATSIRLHLAYREEFQPELSSDDLGFRVAVLPLP